MARERTEEPVVVAGVRAVEALLRHAPDRLLSVEHTDDVSGARARVLEACAARGVPTRIRSPKQLDALADGLRHQGVLAHARPAPYAAWADLVARPDALLLAVDQVTDPRNLGAMLRSAEALGASGALLTTNRCARLGPVVTRTSAGAAELLPVAIETNLARALRAAQAAGLQVVGADLDGAPPDRIDWSRPSVLVIGAEGRGLRRLTRELCDATATIPLSGVTESLNAAVAASVLLYAAVHQRAASGGTEKSDKEG